MVHQGTYNAAPVSAAAGIATLEQIRESDAIDRANRTAAAIRDGINARNPPARIAMVRLWPVFGFPSCIAATPRPRTSTLAKFPGRQLKGAVPLELVNKIRAGFLLHGVDIAAWPGGFASAAHTR